MKPHDTKDQASESHHEKIYRAKKMKFKEPKKKHLVIIKSERVYFKTNMKEKQALEHYKKLYPDCKIEYKSNTKMK